VTVFQNKSQEFWGTSREKRDAQPIRNSSEEVFTYFTNEILTFVTNALSPVIEISKTY